MNLNFVSRGTLLCMYQTGDYVKLIGHPRGFCLLETENGEHYYLRPPQAADIHCTKSTEPARNASFTNNAALGYALRSAEEAATRILSEGTAPLEEREAAKRAVTSIQELQHSVDQRIRAARAQATVDAETIRTFLDELKDSPKRTDIFLGHDVSLIGSTKLLIDGTQFDFQAGTAYLSSLTPKVKGKSLDELLKAASAQSEKSSGRGNKRSPEKNESR